MFHKRAGFHKGKWGIIACTLNHGRLNPPGKEKDYFTANQWLGHEIIIHRKAVIRL